MSPEVVVAHKKSIHSFLTPAAAVVDLLTRRSADWHPPRCSRAPQSRNLGWRSSPARQRGSDSPILPSRGRCRHLDFADRRHLLGDARRFYIHPTQSQFAAHAHHSCGLMQLRLERMRKAMAIGRRAARSKRSGRPIASRQHEYRLQAPRRVIAQCQAHTRLLRQRSCNGEPQASTARFARTRPF